MCLAEDLFHAPCTHARMHTCTHAHMHACMQAHMAHAHANARVPAHAYAHIGVQLLDGILHQEASQEGHETLEEHGSHRVQRIEEQTNSPRDGGLQQN